MRIESFRLENFRNFKELVMEGLGDDVVLVSRNGQGKSTILEAIAGVKDLVKPYHRDDYQFRSSDGRRTFSVWPNHRRPPIRFGATAAKIEMTIGATEHETEFLEKQGVKDLPGKIFVKIENGRMISELNANNAALHLFQYHNPTQRIGFLDYHLPIRHHGDQGVGNATQPFDDNALRARFTDFEGGASNQNKFSDFKSYVVALAISDSTKTKQAGQIVDSLAAFRKVFNEFFSPKTFIGPEFSEDKKVLEVLIGTPYGKHDMDLLSDGEKEILLIMGHFFRFRDLANTILWDTPELHLNAALEGKLAAAIRTLGPQNQYWIATHSLELIGSCPLQSIYVLKASSDGIVLERLKEQNRKRRVELYAELGAQVGLQLVSSLVAFVEGKEASKDKRLLDRLFETDFPYMTFVAGRDCETIIALGSRSNDLIREACANGDFLAIVDRDYRSDQDVEKIQSDYKQKVFVWDVHEIENLFLIPEIVFETLKHVGKLNDFKSADDVKKAILNAALDLREYIAADWVRAEVSSSFRRPSGQINRESPFKSLQEFAARVKDEGNKFGDEGVVSAQFAEKLAQVDRFCKTFDGLKHLPGKEILRHFLQKHVQWSDDDFLDCAVGTVIDKKIPIPALEKLRAIIRQRYSPEKTG